MFGKQYAHHPEVLIHSFQELNKRYHDRAQTSVILLTLRKLYISLFGIPEIGFHVRNMYFKKILSLNLLDHHLPKILDAGCGIGAYAFLLGHLYPNSHITGGEIDRYKLRACRTISRELKMGNMSFMYMDLTKLKQPAKYDLIVNIDVLEHIGNYELVIRNFYKSLRKNGYLYIHVPQPDQKRIFSTLKNWSHEDHVREGIKKTVLERYLKKKGFAIIMSKETYGFFGKIAWEINHVTLSKSLIIAGILFPVLYLIAKLDLIWSNKKGLGVAVLAQKK